jgi:hypothetical protein
MTKRKFGRQQGLHWKQRGIDYTAFLIGQRLVDYIANTKEFQDAVSTTITEFLLTNNSTIKYESDGTFKEYKGSGIGPVFTPFDYEFVQSENAKEIE